MDARFRNVPDGLWEQIAPLIRASLASPQPFPEIRFAHGLAGSSHLPDSFVRRAEPPRYAAAPVLPIEAPADDAAATRAGGR